MFRKNIYFIRHGQTLWNKMNLKQGVRNDIPLNDVGIEQSVLTGKYFKSFRPPIDLIISSPLLRTKQTSKLIANEIEYPNDKIVYSKDIIQQDHGLKLKIYPYDKFIQESDEITRHHEIVHNKLVEIQDPIARTEYLENEYRQMLEVVYGCEPNVLIEKRIEHFVENLKNFKEQNIIVISHSGIIKKINEMILGVDNLDESHFDKSNGSNCQITYFKYYDELFHLVMFPNTLHFKIYGKKYDV